MSAWKALRLPDGRCCGSRCSADGRVVRGDLCALGAVGLEPACPEIAADVR